MILIDDLRIGNISVYTEKHEDKDFCFNCTSRIEAGFVYITGGDGIFVLNGAEHRIKRYDMIIVQKGDRYSIKSGTDGISYITTAFEIIPANAFKLFGIPNLLNIEKFPLIENRIFDILKIWQERYSLYVPKARIELERTFIEIINICTQFKLGVNWGDRIFPAIEHINRNYDNKITIEELAQLCCMSVTHFRRVFKEKIGITPMQFRENIRIYWAKELIESQQLSLNEISEQLGFSDIYHFSRTFKKETGVSPSKYKKH